MDLFLEIFSFSVLLGCWTESTTLIEMTARCSFALWTGQCHTSGTVASKCFCVDFGSLQRLKSLWYLVPGLLGQMRSIFIHLAMEKSQEESRCIRRQVSTALIHSQSVFMCPGASSRCRPMEKVPRWHMFKKKKVIMGFVKETCLESLIQVQVERNISVLQELCWIVEDLAKRWWKGCCCLCMLLCA